jgi:hypothetical protein
VPCSVANIAQLFLYIPDKTVPVTILIRNSSVDGETIPLAGVGGSSGTVSALSPNS